MFLHATAAAAHGQDVQTRAVPSIGSFSDESRPLLLGLAFGLELLEDEAVGVGAELELPVALGPSQGLLSFSLDGVLHLRRSATDAVVPCFAFGFTSAAPLTEGAGRSAWHLRGGVNVAVSRRVAVRMEVLKLFEWGERRELNPFLRVGVTFRSRPRTPATDSLQATLTASER